MTEEASSQAYKLRYVPEEDRLVVSLDIGPNIEWGAYITRRLAKQLVGALADLLARQGGEPLRRNEFLRETVLSFAHTKAIVDATAEGTLRTEPQTKSFAAAPRLVREIKLTPGSGAATTLVFDDGEKSLSTELTEQGAHILIGTLLDLAQAAGWDFPAMAAWLDDARGAPRSR